MQQEQNTGVALYDLWDNMKKVWKELPAELVLGNKQHRNKQWISQKTIDKWKRGESRMQN